MEKTVGNLKIRSVDESAFGVNHAFGIYHEGESDGVKFTTIEFQKGPVKEFGINGITEEVLLEIIIDRLEGFQKTEFCTGLNRDALTNLYAALGSLNDRTALRILRGVEGASVV